MGQKLHELAFPVNAATQVSDIASWCHINRGVWVTNGAGHGAGNNTFATVELSLISKTLHKRAHQGIDFMKGQVHSCGSNGRWV